MPHCNKSLSKVSTSIPQCGDANRQDNSGVPAHLLLRLSHQAAVLPDLPEFCRNSPTLFLSSYGFQSGCCLILLSWAQQKMTGLWANSSPLQICLLQDLNLYFLPNFCKSRFLDVLELNSRLRNQSPKTNHKRFQLCHVPAFPIPIFFSFFPQQFLQEVGLFEKQN